jgi:hypothetical protein
MFRALWQRFTQPKSRVKSGSRSPRRRSLWTIRPSFESLENRITPVTYTVNTLSDLAVHSGLSLRDAVDAADHNPNSVIQQWRRHFGPALGHGLQQHGFE